LSGGDNALNPDPLCRQEICELLIHPFAEDVLKDIPDNVYHRQAIPGCWDE
jgi:hypothetical protein